MTSRAGKGLAAFWELGTFLNTSRAAALHTHHVHITLVDDASHIPCLCRKQAANINAHTQTNLYQTQA